MENGNIIEGNVSAMDEESMVIRRKIGTFTDRIDLVFLSQETLLWLKANPKYAEFVDPFIELPDQILGRKSVRHSLFDGRIASFEDDKGAYNQADAEGFIKLNALRLRMNAKQTSKIKTKKR
jgi:hypothetical protein